MPPRRPPPFHRPRLAALALALPVALAGHPTPTRNAQVKPPAPPVATSAAALPVRISSNTMTLTRLRQNGKTVVDRNIYQGHVVLHQGPITIWAETTILRLNTHGQLLFARALGQPVRFVRTAKRGPPIRGTALAVTYNPATTTYTLVGHVHVERGTQSIVAHEITYNTLTRILVARRGNRHRIHMIIPSHPGRP